MQRNTELIGINNAEDFVEVTLDDGDEFIVGDVHKNTSFARGNYKNKLVIVLHSVLQHHQFNTDINNTHKYA